MRSSVQPVALVTGGSAGLGRVVAQTLLANGYHVMIVGRDADRLTEASQWIRSESASGRLSSHVCDVAQPSEVDDLFHAVADQFGRLDLLVNCVGTSDRGLIERLTSQRVMELVQQNVLTALLCCQASLPLLRESRGVIVNVGSLASKVGARYLGGYAIAKHALAGMTQQLRLELKPEGIHVALVSPGPIRREDAGRRYNEAIDTSLPEQAAKPGGGARVKGLPPQRVADAILRCARRRGVDIVLPGYLRLFITIGHAFPRLGDWLLLRFTTGK